MAIITTAPSIPVLQSDTFEIQRQKINNMGTDVNNNSGPRFIAPNTAIAFTTAVLAYTQKVVTSYGVPAGVRSVILEITIGTNSDPVISVVVKPTSAGSEYTVASTKAAGNGDNTIYTTQATVPIDAASSSFYIKIAASTGVNGATNGCVVKIVGYYY